MINFKRIKLFTIFLIIVLLLSSCAANLIQDTIPLNNIISPKQAITDTLGTEIEPISFDISESQKYETIQVIFFDVGQGDCTLIKIGNHAMLIDAGNVGQENLILGYLADYGITSLDLLVETHPHSDHIGSMAAVIKNMDNIGTLLMPDVIHTTLTFEKLLDAIEEKNIAVTIPNPGETFEMGEAKIQVLAPNSNSYSDLNNYSIVLRMEYGQTAFLFAGDAENISEDEQLAAEYNLSADILKIGHHGSHSSTTQKYLTAISPAYAVICCGTDNSYGHPHDEIISRLYKYGVTIYRTDENGTIIFESDGNKLSVTTDKKMVSEVSSTTAPNNSIMYIGNKNSKIFHLPTCSKLPDEKNRIYFASENDAITKNYRPCQKCLK